MTQPTQNDQFSPDELICMMQVCDNHLIISDGTVTFSFKEDNDTLTIKEVMAILGINKGEDDE